MYVIHKLKPNYNFKNLLIPFGSIVVGAFFGFLLGLEAMFFFFAAFFWIYGAYSFLTYVRTHNVYFLVPALYQATVGLMAFAFGKVGIHNGRNPLIGFLMVGIIFFLVWLVVLAATKKIKWRGREVLELAAMPVEKTGNGYTPRPLVAGKTEFSRHQLLEFVEFTRRNLIAVPYLSKDKVVFVPVMEGSEFPFIIGLKYDYLDETWIAFDFEGNVSVNISHRDYLEYQEALSFDQLCKSLGNLFIEFIEIFQRGEGIRIIDRMNALGIPWHS